jgi:hypothetical protein
MANNSTADNSGLVKGDRDIMATSFYLIKGNVPHATNSGAGKEK